jgi:hypothetical protein
MVALSSRARGAAPASRAQEVDAGHHRRHRRLLEEAGHGLGLEPLERPEQRLAVALVALDEEGARQLHRPREDGASLGGERGELLPGEGLGLGDERDGSGGAVGPEDEHPPGPGSLGRRAADAAQLLRAEGVAHPRLLRLRPPPGGW